MFTRVYALLRSESFHSENYTYHSEWCKEEVNQIHSAWVLNVVFQLSLGLKRKHRSITNIPSISHTTYKKLNRKPFICDTNMVQNISNTLLIARAAQLIKF